MLKITVLLLFSALLCGKPASAQSCCHVNYHWIDQKIHAAVSSAVSAANSKMKLICTTVSQRGAYVTCPLGYKATACSCGKACGSWDIQSDTICHCQCRKIDWTSSRCCKVTLSG